MKYTSTRDTAVEVTSAEAVISGISKDGGLFVPKELPSLDYKKMFELDYAARADMVLRAFFDFDVDGITESAYSSFDSDDPAPVVKLDDNLFVMELWHGRTCAFKDMALSVLPRLLTSAKKSVEVNEKTLILVATSGDTGKAALEGFRDVEGTEAIVFYPTDGVSEVQKLAMQTQDGNNVCAVGIKGNFDDAQSAVKKAFNDAELVGALKEKGIAMSSANSINIGRLVPQIAYYFSAYCDLVDSGEIKKGDKIDFCVPTGNFGNILAGWYAYKMGLPVNKLICASNRNNVLTDFINTGTYDINRRFYKTTSPSMDILVSSNLERLLFETSGRDAEIIKKRMNDLGASGRYQVTPKEIEEIRTVMASGFADDEACADAIADIFDEYGYLIDTHTAAAYAVAKERDFPHPTVIVSTANPFKFAPAVLNALGVKCGDAVTKETFAELEDESAMDAPERLTEVFDKAKRFTDVVEKEEITAFIRSRFGV